MHRTWGRRWPLTDGFDEGFLVRVKVVLGQGRSIVIAADGLGQQFELDGQRIAWLWPGVSRSGRFPLLLDGSAVDPQST